MTDLIKEIRLLEQGADHKLTVAKRQHEQRVLTAKRAAIETIASAQQGIASERDERILHKQAALDATKSEFLQDAHNEATRITEGARTNLKAAVEFILNHMTERSKPKSREASE